MWVCAYCVAGVFRGNKAQVKEYQDLLEPIIFQSYEGESSQSLIHTNKLTHKCTYHFSYWSYNNGSFWNFSSSALTPVRNANLSLIKSHHPYSHTTCCDRASQGSSVQVNSVFSPEHGGWLLHSPALIAVSRDSQMMGMSRDLRLYWWVHKRSGIIGV